MIISRTPFRISFFGGGTDYPAWYLKEGGSALSTTIDKYCFITCRFLPPFFREYKHRVVWRHVENVYNISDILHPAVREGLPFLGYDDTDGLEIHYQGDLPARSGMGSSSSFAVGLINALTALRGKTISKHDLALKAIELEQEILKESVGSQDQMAVAYGGLNIFRFLQTGQIIAEPIIISQDRKAELQSRLLLFYTGTSRVSTKIASETILNMSKKKDVFRKMHSYVDDALSILKSNGDLDEFGQLLHKSWMLKRQYSEKITNSHIDSIYKTALDNGALGGKLLGAGASGFMIFYVSSNNKSRMINALSDYLHVPFKFDSEGSSLIYYGLNNS